MELYIFSREIATTTRNIIAYYYEKFTFSQFFNIALTFPYVYSSDMCINIIEKQKQLILLRDNIMQWRIIFSVSSIS